MSRFLWGLAALVLTAPLLSGCLTMYHLASTTQEPAEVEVIVEVGAELTCPKLRIKLEVLEGALRIHAEQEVLRDAVVEVGRTRAAECRAVGPNRFGGHWGGLEPVNCSTLCQDMLLFFDGIALLPVLVDIGFFTCTDHAWHGACPFESSSPPGKIERRAKLLQEWRPAAVALRVEFEGFGAWEVGSDASGWVRFTAKRRLEIRDPPGELIRVTVSPSAEGWEGSASVVLSRDAVLRLLGSD